jgi:Tol biopolymer transport system component
MKRQLCMLAGCAIAANLFLTEKAAAQGNYDLYMLDVKTGATTNLTHLYGINAYNASWSNNGKQIVFDYTGPYGQSLFILDVKTGVSTPLAGNLGGNDGAWSPNGKTIAFDAWDYSYDIGQWTQNIYTLPAAGGDRSLVRLNAHHASWNQSSNAIAFDDAYGYIGTKNLTTGAETIVTSYGDRPSWSPNGRYIAFDGWPWLGGGVWVIEVDASGNPQGAPRQLTESGAGPTWKNNNKEIVFVDWSTGDPDLYSIPVNGGTPTRIAGRTGGFDKGDYDPAFSNNGQYLVWSSYTDGLLTQATNGIKQKTAALPEKSGMLEQNTPNPFTDHTQIGFRLTEASHVTVRIYNIAGQMVKTLTDANYNAGSYTLNWNGNDGNNAAVPAGVYFYRIEAGPYAAVRKMNVRR